MLVFSSLSIRSAARPSPSKFFFLLMRLPPTATLFPYTTLFRSFRRGAAGADFLDARDPRRTATRHEERAHRSEEHTSELQSQSNLVCRLLLEKNKPRTPPADLVDASVHAPCALAAHTLALPNAN